MLKTLFVKNYALIKELEIGFDKGLTIITGETGAGKSILLGALGLILGQRADSSVQLDKSNKCIVESYFDLKGVDSQWFFEENELDFSETLVMRREISPGGRSRAFINDTPVTLDLMKELGSILIDIHSQHQTLMLGKNQFQLSIIDSFANHKNLLSSYSKTYRDFREKGKEYSALSEGYDKAQADFEYYNHQLKQLDEINLIAGEEIDLEKERDLLLHSEEVNEALSTASLALNGDEAATIPVLGDLKRRLEKIVEYLPESKGYLERLDSVAIELNDLANEMERKSGVVDSDPARLNILSERLDLLFTLMQKHRSESVVSLIEERESIRGIVDKISLSDERMTVLKSELNKLNEVLLETGRQISDNRAEIAPVVETKMSELLAALGMPNARFVINIHKLDDFGPDGFDHADFLFTSNKQVPPENLNKVASGGELSRVMLSLKSLLSDKMGLPTIFFDEIDAGVSGEVATRVGEILSKMGREMQVINITHLPQVAAHAEMHYFVFKEDNADSTITHIKLLDKNERLNEVARLLSGNEITRASLDNARNLINGI